MELDDLRRSEAEVCNARQVTSDSGVFRARNGPFVSFWLLKYGTAVYNSCRFNFYFLKKGS